jgi:cell fate (sporulation/competence/biofilm development) regulator YlbF (YheA/YmcA/DUF963 family)
MPFEEETQGFFQRTSRFWKILLTVIGCGGFLAGVYFLGEATNPEPLDKRAMHEQFADDEEMSEQAIKDRVAELEEAFLDAWNSGMVGEEERAMIAEAVRLQSRYAGRYPNDRIEHNRLTELRKLHDNARAQPLYQSFERLRERAGKARDAGNEEQAADLISEAIDVINTINLDYPLSRYRDTTLETAMRSELVSLRLAPQRREAQRHEDLAHVAEAENRWDAAITHLEEAIALYTEIIKKADAAGDVGSSSLNRKVALENKLASLQSAGEHKQVNLLVSQAEELEADGRYLEAADRYLDARDLQRTINEEYPMSEFASANRAEALYMRMQTARSRELADAIHADSDRLDQYLRTGQVTRASQLVNELADKAERFRTNYPLSEAIGDDDVLKLKILKHLRSDFGYLQDHIASNLKPVPGMDGVFLFDHEVTQALYRTIMNANPSQEPLGDAFPVHALTWLEAEAFCERLGWIMARPVRLPSREEYRAALGSLKYLSARPDDDPRTVDLDAISWNQRTADGRIQKVETTEPNVAGFHDLLGNVAEWLRPGPDMAEGEALVIGGSAIDSTDSLIRLPQETREKSERTRLIGFRFVVEWGGGGGEAPAPETAALEDGG